MGIIFVTCTANKEHSIVSSGKSRNSTTAYGDQPKPNVSVRYTKPSSPQLPDSEEAVFDNPIYGVDDNDKVNGDVEIDPKALLSTSLPDHEFDNPIYAIEETENAYSMITDASTHNSATTGQLQATYKSIHDELPNSYRPLIDNSTFGQL